MSAGDRKRIFVVGLSRSGTTLIQGMLNNRDDIVSFPESHFFSFVTFELRHRMYGDLAPGDDTLAIKRFRRFKSRFATWRGKANPVVKERIALFLERAELQEYVGRFTPLPNRIKPLADAFIELLDEVAGDYHWVEKTPNHVFFTRLIERHVPDARFIHIIRKGEDALGSIMDAAQKYPSWAKRHMRGERTVPCLIALRNNALKASLADKGRPGHLHVSYEGIIADPETHARRISDFLGLQYETGITRIDTSGAFNNKEEPWKADMGQTIKPPKAKFETVFTPDEQVQILRGLIPVPDDLFE